MQATVLVDSAAWETEAATVEPDVDDATVDDDTTADDCDPDPGPPNPPCGIACASPVSDRSATEVAKNEGSILKSV